MPLSFSHELPVQRVIFAAGAVARIGEEAARLGFARALVVTTPGSGARLGARVIDLLGARAVALHAQATMHVPKPVAQAGLAAARAEQADGLVAVGGGAAIGLAKIIARDLALPILAVPTTYSGSEATAIWGLTDGQRKLTGRDPHVLPRVIVYDPELTFTLSAAVSAASAMNALAHCVEGMWVPERTPYLEALASEAAGRFAHWLAPAIAAGVDPEARAQCLAAAWLAGVVLAAGTGLQHKLAHVLGGVGLPHAETHAVILPHVTRFNLASAPTARARLAVALGDDDPAARLAAMLARLPLPQRLSELGFERARIEPVAAEIAAMAIALPRPVSGADARALLTAAY